MQWPRSSGVLLHVTSLPGQYGIGDLGPEARRFAEWLAAGKQTMWQMLPLAPTGYGDSPYQALSAFAGNTLLISIEDLVRDGLLDRSDLETAPQFSEGAVDFEAVKRFKLPLLRKAHERFCGLTSFNANHRGQDELVGAEYVQFEQESAAWLEEYALFAALKAAHGQRAWVEWERPLRKREDSALAQAREQLRDEIEVEKFAQFIFARQWKALREYCRERGVRLMGDLPIYVAHDSADVWTHPELFLLDEEGRARVVAGVPPDYFSATGQLWGNPIYDWERHEESGFRWWIARVRAMLSQFDFLRIDHFRGFEAYWAVPGGDKTAERGQWVKAPGQKLFEALEAALGELPVLAENLGVITAEVEALRTRFRLPGMAILQFAFGNDAQAPYFKPHNYTQDRVAYSGTHDNDTVVGWWERREPTATESAEEIRKQHEYAAKYLGLSFVPAESQSHEVTKSRSHDFAVGVNWAFIRALMASVAECVIFPMQDVLGLGTESRMNYPGTSSGNWRWRARPEELRSSDAELLRELAEIYER